MEKPHNYLILWSCPYMETNIQIRKAQVSFQHLKDKIIQVRGTKDAFVCLYAEKINAQSFMEYFLLG